MAISVNLQNLASMTAATHTRDDGTKFGVIAVKDEDGNRVAIFTDPDTARIVVAAYDATKAVAAKEAV